MAAHLSEIADFGLIRINKNLIMCKVCRKTGRLNHRKKDGAQPVILDFGWEKPCKCFDAARTAKRRSRAGRTKRDPKATEYVPLGPEESLARQAKLASLRDLWSRYVSAHEAGKLEMAKKLYSRYLATGGMASPLPEPEAALDVAAETAVSGRPAVSTALTFPSYEFILREPKVETVGDKHDRLTEEADVLLKNMISSTADKRISKLNGGESG